MSYRIVTTLDNNKRISKEEVEKCVKAIRKLIIKNKDIVKIEFDDKYCNDKYNINFNGYGKDAHETFIFYSMYKENIAEEIIDSLENKENAYISNIISASGVFERNNMITNRKPYDKVVKQALMKCQEVTNNKFKITCDDGFIYFKDKIKKGKKIYKSLEEMEKLKKRNK